MDISDIDTLVLSGGGMKGIAHIGALKVLSEYNFKFKKIIGCSIGSIIGALFLLDFTTEEIEEVMEANITELFDLDIEKFLDMYGFESGNKLLNYFIEKISKKHSLEFINSLTLKKMYNFSGVHFSIITTCISDQTIVTLDHTTFPNLNLIHALRMSMSIPFLFTSVKWKDKYYVDGGLLSNYPFDLVKDHTKAIGIDLNGSKIENKIVNIKTFEDFLFSVYKCIDKRFHKHPHVNSTVYINLDGYSPIDFSMETDKKKELLLIGYNVTEKYILSKFKIINLE